MSWPLQQAFTLLPHSEAMRLLVLAAFLIAPVGTAYATAFDALAPGRPAGASPAAQCRAAIASAEHAAGIPDRLMQSIGIMESGRRDETGVVSAYPWTINAQGVGSYYASKAEAIAAVTALRARGVNSIDVGCMQVNLMHHASAFASLDEAFDPAANANYAARFLTRLLGQTGSWPGATAGYHSLTPGIGDEYARKVLAIWTRPAPHGTPAPAIAPAVTAEAPSAWPTPPTGRHGADHPVARRRNPRRRAWTCLLPRRTDAAGLCRAARPGLTATSAVFPGVKEASAAAFGEAARRPMASGRATSLKWLAFPTESTIKRKGHCPTVP